MNKYRHLNPPPQIEEGTVNLTYGIAFFDNVKAKSHAPSRPFISLIKLSDEQILSLKLSSHNSERFSDYKISTKKYGTSAVMSKNSYVSTNYLYNLNAYDYIKAGFKLDQKDLMIIYSRIIRMFCINASEITIDQAKLIFKKYMANRFVGVGSVIRIPYLAERLFVYEKNEQGYKCLIMHQTEQDDSQDMLRIMKAPIYINYDEEIFVDKNEIFYVYQSRSEKELVRLIRERKYSQEKRKDALFSKKFTLTNK